MRSVTIALALAGLSAAQSTTSLFIPGAAPQPLIASIIGSDTIATTYAIECVPGTDSSDCGFAGGFTLTEGPSTAAYTLSFGYENGTSSVLAFTGYIDCTMTGGSAVCTESFGGEEANDPGMSTTTLDPTEFTSMAVTITDSLPSDTILGFAATAGLAGSTTSNSASPSTTKSAPTASNTSSGKSTSAGKSTSTTGTASGTGAVQSTGTTSSSTAGAAQAMMTGKAQWVIGAAAAGLALL